MLRMGLTPLAVVGLVITLGGCNSQSQQLVVEGRGCPIPKGPEAKSGATAVSFLEMYSPHASSPNRVRLDIRPSGSDAELEVLDSQTKQPLLKDKWYLVIFHNEKSTQTITVVEEASSKKLVDAVKVMAARPSLGDPNVDGYANPGITIYKTDDRSIEFGLRVNGLSVPIRITQ